MFTDDALQKKYQAILPHLNEQTTRLYLASEAQTLGRGGKTTCGKIGRSKPGQN